MKCTTNNLKYTNIELNQELAGKNFKNHITENVYPGRGIVLGRNHGGVHQKSLLNVDYTCLQPS